MYVVFDGGDEGGRRGLLEIIKSILWGDARVQGRICPILIYDHPGRVRV